MASVSVEDGVMQEIALVCAVDRRAVREQALIVEYGVDSLRAMEMIAALEERYEIVIDDRDAARVRTVRDVIEIVHERLA